MIILLNSFYNSDIPCKKIYENMYNIYLEPPITTVMSKLAAHSTKY